MRCTGRASPHSKGFGEPPFNLHSSRGSQCLRGPKPPLLMSTTCRTSGNAGESSSASASLVNPSFQRIHALFPFPIPLSPTTRRYHGSHLGSGTRRGRCMLTCRGWSCKTYIASSSTTARNPVHNSAELGCSARGVQHGRAELCSPHQTSVGVLPWRQGRAVR